jgi:hypothetical protein
MLPSAPRPDAFLRTMGVPEPAVAARRLSAAVTKLDVGDRFSPYGMMREPIHAGICNSRA